MTTTPWTQEELDTAIAEFEENGMKDNVPSELQDEVTWGDYKDHEKREMAFSAGARWALQHIKDVYKMDFP